MARTRTRRRRLLHNHLRLAPRRILRAHQFEVDSNNFRLIFGKKRKAWIGMNGHVSHLRPWIGNALEIVLGVANPRVVPITRTLLSVHFIGQSAASVSGFFWKPEIKRLAASRLVNTSPPGAGDEAVQPKSRHRDDISSKAPSLNASSRRELPVPPLP